MSHRPDDHHRGRDHTPDGANAALSARKPWHAPIVIASAAADTEKFTVHSIEGGSYPTTHGPS